MITIVVFLIITFFLLSKLNEIIGLNIGFRVEKENLGDFSEPKIKEISVLDKKIQLVKSNYKSFQLDEFLEKSRKVFKVIFQAYAEGDKSTLKNLLAARTYTAFCMAIDDRQKRGEILEGSIESFSSTEFLDAEIVDRNIYVTVKFVTEQSNVLKAADGKVLEGNADFVETRTDVWVFSRPVSSTDSRWILHEIKSED